MTIGSTRGIIFHYLGEHPLFFFHTLFTSPKFIVLFLTVMIPLVTCIYFTFLGNTIKNKLRIARSWPCTEGKIILSEVCSNTNTNQVNDRIRTAYFAKIQYSYSVDNKMFTSKRLNLSKRFETTSRETIEEYTRQYPIGSNVIVHHNPKAPEEAIVETDIKSNTAFYRFAVFVTGIGALMFSFGLVFGIGEVIKDHEDDFYRQQFKSPEEYQAYLEKIRMEIENFDSQNEDTSTVNPDSGK